MEKEWYTVRKGHKRFYDGPSFEEATKSMKPPTVSSCNYDLIRMILKESGNVNLVKLTFEVYRSGEYRSVSHEVLPGIRLEDLESLVDSIKTA